MKDKNLTNGPGAAQPSRAARITNAILAAFLLVTIFVFGYMTIKPNFDTLFESARSYSRLKNYMPAEGYTFLEHTAARIRSLEDRFNEVLWKKDELGYMNSSVQYALGKDMINTGSSNMVTLETGALYDLPAYVDTSNQTAEIIAFAETLDVPFLYVFEHPTTYGDNVPSGGYALLDNGTRLSDEIVAALREGGLKVIDSRDVLKDEDVSRIIWKTDQHWTYYAALVMAGDVADALGLDSELLDPSRFESLTLEKKFLGKYGQKVGPGNIDPDDITVFWPEYDTCIERYTILNGEESSAEGEFREAAIKWDYLNVEGWSIEAYKAYGLTEDFEHYHNENAPSDMTILIYKDSFGSPVGAFMSLVAKDVYLVDMRKQEQYAPYFVEKYQPDAVVIAYSQQMVCGNEYDLLEGY